MFKEFILNNEHLTEIIVALLQLFTALVVGFLGYKYALIQLRKESKENIERKKYDSILLAHKSIYSLLAYTTDTFNAKSILLWERKKMNNQSIDLFYFRKDNAQLFIEELSKEFYEKGNGLFLSAEITALFYEYRSIIYGFLLKEVNNPEINIKIKNDEMVKKMKNIHQSINKKMREMINLNERDLKKL